jgi:pyruvate ferredoxin oxidoreductase beta subunit
VTSIRELAQREPRLTAGHRACAGCLSVVALRQALGAIEDPIVAVGATGCMEVVTSIFPYSAWNMPFMHNAFENAAATLSGVEAAHRALRERGEVPDRDVRFLCFSGDGGAYDIGLQSLSGALERGTEAVFVCYDNEGYMNTGVQRSSATPIGAATNTTPDAAIRHGETRPRKDLTEIVVAHGVPYVAQACVTRWKDYVRKIEKAVRTRGPAFVNVLAPCTLGWKYPAEKGLEVGELAIETCFWPLYEVEEGRHRLSYRPRDKRPIADWTRLQGRFRHLERPENAAVLEALQADVDRRWDLLLRRCSH